MKCAYVSTSPGKVPTVYVCMNLLHVHRRENHSALFSIIAMSDSYS